MSQINGKTVLITGAAMGMGRLFAERFGAEGGELVLVDISAKALDETAAALRAAGYTVHTFTCDLGKKKNVDELARKVKEQVGPVDILVNNAGVVTGGRYEEIDDKSDERMMNVNMAAVHWLTKRFVVDMKELGSGHIVQLASAAGLLGVPEQVVYCASKWFVIGLSEALRLELAQEGFEDIHMTIVCPSFVNTGMFEGVKPPMLTPMLEPEFVVDRVVEAVKKNRLYVKEPFIVKTTPVLRALLPPFLFDRIADKMGVTRSMHTWKGH